MAGPKAKPHPELAKFFRRQRAAFGWTLDIMAQEWTDAGVKTSPESLSRYERTGAVPAMNDPDVVRALALVYHTTNIELYRLTGQIEGRLPATEVARIADELPRLFLAILDDMEAEDIELLATIAAAILRYRRQKSEHGS